MPEDAVQHVFRTRVRLAEIQTRGDIRVAAQQPIRNLFRLRVHFVQRHIAGHSLERGEIRCISEAVKHWCGRRIKLVHGREPEDLFDGAQKAGGVVLGCDHRPTPSVRADAVGGRAITAHMVPTSLRIIFDRKDHGLFPKPALADCFSDPSEREIIVGDASRRRGRTFGRAAGVVVGQADDGEVGELAASLSFPQFTNDKIGPVLVRHSHFPADVVGRLIRADGFNHRIAGKDHLIALACPGAIASEEIRRAFLL